MDQSTIFALVIIVTLAVISIAAIVKYSTVDEALKVLSVLTGLFGATISAAGTYYFTRGEVKQAASEISEAKTTLTTETTKREAAEQAAAVYSSLVKLPEEKRATLAKQSPAIKDLLKIKIEGGSAPTMIWANKTRELDEAVKVLDVQS
jgi:hypothetical protein